MKSVVGALLPLILLSFLDASLGKFAGGKPTVVDGPFTETKELIAGFWLIQAKSKQEAIEWARRVPFVDGEVEVRQVFELEDFGQSEAVDLHAKHRKQLSKR